MLDRVLNVRWTQLEWHCGAVPARCGAVAGFDNSLASRTALAYASGWAHRNHAGLIVVHVDTVTGPRALETAFALSAWPAPECVPTDLSGPVADAMADAVTPWAYLTTDGDVAQQLETVADAVQADAIIVGRSRRALHSFRGSVSRRLVASSRRIVVVVP